MIYVFMILSLMLFHWFADFVFQNDSMATKKSTSNWWLTYHVAVYSAAMLPIALAWFGALGFIWVAINGSLHWITDYYTSKLSSHFFKNGDNRNGFVIVGFDQYIHLVCILVTAWAFS